MTLRLYDYVQVGDSIMERAKQEASRVLSEAGIEAEWLSCPLTMAELQSNPSCSREAGPTDLVLRILPKTMRPEVSSETGTLGYALIRPGDSNPRITSILFSNVERLAWARDEDSSYGPIHRAVPHERYVGILLGHVMAHEIGHLLLASNEHARRGLMQPHWSAAATEMAITQRLEFESGEKRQIRADLIRREVARK